MTVDTAKANKLLIRDCNNAPREIQRAWGRGGPQGVRLVKRFDTWFRDDLTVRIMDLHGEGEITKEAITAALEACAAILAFDEIPHWDHVDDIHTIRGVLKPDQYWGDWPERSDDEDEM